ncbi:MAG: cell division protein FtsQ/DivIB [Anaerolineaceae bacterium]
MSNPKELSRAEQARLRRINQSSRRAESASKNIATQVGRRRPSQPAMDLSGLLKSGFGLFKEKKTTPNSAVERITNFYPNRDVRRPSIITDQEDRNIYTLIRKLRFQINKPGGLLHRRPARPIPVNMRPVSASENTTPLEKPKTNVYFPRRRPLVGHPGQAVNTNPPSPVSGPMAYQSNRNVIVPRMMARAGASALPFPEQPKSRVRRMIYYSLGSTGVEIKLPALPILHPSWRLLSGFMAALLSGAIALLIFAPQFKISSVEVTGLQRLDPATISPILAMNNLPIIDLDPSGTSSQVQAGFPELQTVQVYANLPSSVVINMVERQPVMVWQNGDTIMWVDAEGYLIPVYGEVGPLLTVQANVPPAMANPVAAEIQKHSLAMGVQFPEKTAPVIEEIAAEPAEPAKLEKIDPELLRSAFELNSMLPSGTTLVFNDRRGLGWIDGEGINVFIGLKFVDMRIKMTEYEVIVKQLALQGIKPHMISVENLDVPFYRMEN